MQTGVILATSSMLHLQALFLEKYLKFLFLSRFSQDALENLFWTLRCKNPVPHVFEFKCTLRAATVSPFQRPSKDGSYAEEDCFLLTGIEEGKPDENKMYVVCPSDLLTLKIWNMNLSSTLQGMLSRKSKK